jgi:methylated-DNA-protein-cysteine methyltransferase-like protein
VEQTFKENVYNLVSKIPQGRVMTYGQIAALCNHPRASRVVGQIAHFGPDYLPWHRVLYKNGSLAGGFPLGLGFQAKLLRAENIIVSNNSVRIDDYIWWPK